MSRHQQFGAWLVLLLFYAALVYLNRITPLWSDDYVYRFVFDARYYYDESFSRLIASWADIYESQLAHYRCTNGRMVAHTLAQAFLFGGQGWLWSLLNSLCFVVSVCLLWRFACGGDCRQKGLGWVGFLLTLGLYWLLLPHPGQLVFWLTGSCNYQWAALWVLAFLNLLMLPARRSVSWLLFPVAVLAGNGNEALSLGLSLSLLAYALFRHREVGLRQAAGLLCFFAGTASNVFSPGAAARLKMAGESVSHADVFTRMDNVAADVAKVMEQHPHLLVVPVVAVLLALLPWGRTRSRCWLLLAAVLSLALAVYVRMIDPRATFGFFLYAFAAALPVVLGLFAALPRRGRALVLLALAVTVGKCMLNAAYDIPRFEAYEQHIVQSARSGCEFVVPRRAAPYSPYNHNTHITQNSVGMHNRALAAYYGTRPFGLLTEGEWAQVQSVPHELYGSLGEGEFCRATEGIFLLRLPAKPTACHVSAYSMPADGVGETPLCWGGLNCAVLERQGGCFVLVFYDGLAADAALCEIRVRLMEGHSLHWVSFDPGLSWGMLVSSPQARR